MTEREDWQTNFGLALSFLKSEEEKMLQDNVFMDCGKLFGWLETTSKNIIKISPVCNGSHLALLVCDKLDRLESGTEILQNIINYAGEKGIISEVKTQSLRYQASVCVSVFLDQKLKNPQIGV